MATVYSLICWGGRTGKTVTISNASPAVVTSTDHGLRDGTGLVFSTTGALPTGITAGVTYYAKSTAANTFNLYDTAAHAIAGGSTGRVNTSSAGSGTHTVKSDLIVNPSTRLSAYGLSDLSRWGTSGSERIYDGIAAWNTARGAATSMASEEVCELGDAFIDILPQSGTDGSYYVAITVPCSKTTIHSYINGKRTSAFHAGMLDAGYVVKSSYYGFNAIKYSTTLDGFGISGLYGGITYLAPGGRAANIIALGRGGGYNGIGASTANTIENCFAAGFDVGIFIAAGANFVTVSSCISVKNGVGIKCQTGYESQTRGLYFNNISVGNTTNWGPTLNFDAALSNAGLSGEAWDTGTSRVTVATSDFATWGAATWAITDNYHPALPSSPQVDSGIQYPDALPVDISGDERPNYNNGGAEAFDIGCYEFNHGYGAHPASYTIELTGIPAGSEVRCYTGSKGASAVEIGGTETSTGTSFSFSHSSAGVAGFIHVIHPSYSIQEFDYTYPAANVSIPIQMPADRWYSNPA